MAAPLIIEPVTPERWDDLADLFGPKGAYGGCWCLYFRVPNKARLALGNAASKETLRQRITAGPPPGVLAYADDLPVGWLQIGPRADVPEWNSPRRVSAPQPDAPADDPGVWAASCFYVRKGWRKRGITAALLSGGIAHAREEGARLIEACPMEPAPQHGAVVLFVGVADTFRRAGFVEVARRRDHRPLMRLVL